MKQKYLVFALCALASAVAQADESEEKLLKTQPSKTISLSGDFYFENSDSIESDTIVIKYIKGYDPKVLSESESNRLELRGAGRFFGSSRFRVFANSKNLNCIEGSGNGEIVLNNSTVAPISLKLSGNFIVKYRDRIQIAKLSCSGTCKEEMIR
jgi:hypothetical protein